MGCARGWCTSVARQDPGPGLGGASSAPRREAEDGPTRFTCSTEPPEPWQLSSLCCSNRLPPAQQTPRLGMRVKPDPFIVLKMG